MKSLTASDKIALISLVTAIIAIIVSLTTPELRRYFKLEENSITPSLIADSTTIKPSYIRKNNTVRNKLKNKSTKPVSVAHSLQRKPDSFFVVIPADSFELNAESEHETGIYIKYMMGVGESIYGVASRYNIYVNTLRALNPDILEPSVGGSVFKTGTMKVNVKVMALHIVSLNDVLSIVAQKYGVSEESIMRANKKKNRTVTLGERLLIPFLKRQ